MPRTYDVYGVGHALVDLQYAVSADFLERLHIRKGVMTLIDAARQRALFQALDRPPLASASGGSAANTMIGVAGFGGRAYYACQVGQDEWGDFYCRDLERALVRCNPANRSPGPTGQCVVFITPDADRTMNTFLGVSSELGPERLETGIIADSAYLYLEGYLVSSDSGFAACLRAQDLARQGRTLISLTLSDPSMVELFRERFAELVAGGVDLLFCNEEEARAFTGQGDRRAAAQDLARRFRAGCVTCGADGALCFEDGRLAAVPGVPARAVDTTGAGDLFAGGVLFGLTHGFGLEQAARLGAYAAAQVVARYGPRLDRPLKDEISRILSNPT